LTDLDLVLSITMLLPRGGMPEGLAEQPQDHGVSTMIFRAAASTFAALAVAGFLFAPAAHASSRPVQVSGNKLKSALLPASDFGSGFQSGPAAGSGNSVLNLPAVEHVSSMSCGTFEAISGQGFFGNNAFAFSYIDNPNPISEMPSTQFYYLQAVDQFASTKAASTYYSQARAKYAKCTYFTETVPDGQLPGIGALETTTQSMSNTRVGKYQAFQVGQVSDLTEMSGITLQLGTLVAVAGTDVYTMESVGGSNDPISTTLMSDLIGRVQKLR
jgi:hypothetical protein